MATQMAGAGVKGYALFDKANVRKGPKKDDPKAGSLALGQEVTVTGYAIDPSAGEFKRRYRIQFNGGEAWVAAKLIALDAQSTQKLPFLPLDLANPADELVKALGFKPKDVTLGLQEATDLAGALGGLELRGEWSKADLEELRKVLSHLESLGAGLGTVDGGQWSLDEIRTVHEAISDTAKGTARLFEDLFKIADDALGFRLLYAPLLINRSPKDNVSIIPDQIWYAKNSNGYEITLSNKVFFKGTQKTKSNPTVPYTAKELIAHEIGHVINWRYPRKRHEGKGLLDKPSVYYPKKVVVKEYVFADGTKVALGGLNVGYTMAARSSDGDHETVTDAIACLNLDRFSVNATDPKQQLQGKARKEQITKLMDDVIRYRVRDYGGGVGALKEEIGERWGAALLTEMLPLIADLATEPNSIDSQIEMLKVKLPS